MSKKTPKTAAPKSGLLDRVKTPTDLKRLSETELQDLCHELRAEMISSVLQTGGHLGASLGVVELTVALHSVFDAPRDKIIWDVGHQSYPHKMLTGRRDRMDSLRQEGGLSGFTKRSESPYDPFGAGHSSTSISAALGFAAARDLGAEDIGEVLAIIGDGAMSAGLAFEALNNASGRNTRVFIILNDNEMSISPPTGALSEHLKVLSEAENTQKTIFETLGISYMGPVCGHDFPALRTTLKSARELSQGPVLIHIRTRKGKGYLPAEQAEDKGHGVSKVQAESQKQTGVNAPTYTNVFSKTLIEQAQKDRRICAVTAAMPDGTGLKAFAQRFADRCFDVGIAEQHAVTFASGLAAAGMRPFCAIYSTFLQRAYDQVVHDVALQSLPVRFAIDRAGLVGADGATHAGAYDIAYLGNLPNFTVMAAADETELQRMVVTAAHHDVGPISFRFPRGSGVGRELSNDPMPLEIGKGRVVREGRGIALLSLGARLAEVEAAYDLLKEEGISPTLVDARFARPLDRELILQVVDHHDALVTIEEGAVGGFGAFVAALLAEERRFHKGLALEQITLPVKMIEHGSVRQMRAQAGLDVAQIQERIRMLAQTIT